MWGSAFFSSFFSRVKLASSPTSCVLPQIKVYQTHFNPNHPLNLYLWWQLQSNKATHMHRQITHHLALCWLSYLKTTINKTMAVDDQNITIQSNITIHVDEARELAAEDKSRYRAKATNNNQPLTGAFSHANIPGRLWQHPCRPVPCMMGAVSLCPPPPLLGHREAGEYSWMVSPLTGVWDVVAMQQKTTGQGVGTTTAMTIMTMRTNRTFLNSSTAHMVANYAIGGAAAGVLFRGMVGYWLQVTNISFNKMCFSSPSHFFSFCHSLSLPFHLKIVCNWMLIAELLFVCYFVFHTMQHEAT
jgi:hypothetical protein